MGALGRGGQAVVRVSHMAAPSLDPGGARVLGALHATPLDIPLKNHTKDTPPGYLWFGLRVRAG